MEQPGATFRFRRNAKIGEAAAEMDDEFLFSSFYDTGDYELLRDTHRPPRIVVGRTGAGKTALLRLLKRKEEHVIEIEPENLSLNFIANNDVIRFFESIGLKLDLFYGLLWRHVFTVELLHSKYQLNTEERTRSFVALLIERFKTKDAARERAIRYIKDWGDKFWIETEYRVKEFTAKLEAELKASAGIDVDYAKASLEGGLKLSEEQKKEIVHRGQQVVNSVQVKELSEVISYLNDEVFTDSQKPYYIVIDRLDEYWVEDSLRFKLIRALIETVKTFQRVSNVKIVVALRQDLLQKVFSLSKETGFQEEKYQALLLKLRWSSKQLEGMLDNRVASLVRQQYTQRPIRFCELFPTKVAGIGFLDYFMQRTALRPRDAILFTNDCIARSEAKGQVKVQTVFEAEKEYSRLRLTSLIEEWSSLYPSLPFAITILRGANQEGRVSALNATAVDHAITEIAGLDNAKADTACLAAAAFLTGVASSRNAVVAELILLLYKVGAIGLRFEGGGGQQWFPENAVPTASQIKPSTKVLVHPMFHQALGTTYLK